MPENPGFNGANLYTGLTQGFLMGGSASNMANTIVLSMVTGGIVDLSRSCACRKEPPITNKTLESYYPAAAGCINNTVKSLIFTCVLFSRFSRGCCERKNKTREHENI
jgi:hypothetical protein